MKHKCRGCAYADFKTRYQYGFIHEYIICEKNPRFKDVNGKEASIKSSKGLDRPIDCKYWIKRTKETKLAVRI